jgi:hypothetical protein
MHYDDDVKYVLLGNAYYGTRIFSGDPKAAVPFATHYLDLYGKYNMIAPQLIALTSCVFQFLCVKENLPTQIDVITETCLRTWLSAVEYKLCSVLYRGGQHYFTILVHCNDVSAVHS